MSHHRLFAGMFDGKINLYDDILFPTKSYEPVFPEMFMGEDDKCRRSGERATSSVSTPNSPDTDGSDSPKVTVSVSIVP